MGSTYLLQTIAKIEVANITGRPFLNNLTYAPRTVMREKSSMRYGQIDNPRRRSSKV